MGLLGDIYSYGDTLKRRVNGLLSDPVGTANQFVGQLRDDMNQSNAALDAYGFGPKKPFVSVLADNRPSIGYQSNPIAVTPQQRESAKGLLAENGAQMGMAGATVWHGSPHTFSKFDASKIGTGEGAQAYGHGLYLAESPQVAGQYQKELGTNVTLNGKPFYDKRGIKLSTTGDSNIDDYLLAHHGDMDAAIADAVSGGDHAAVPALQALKEKGAVQNQNTGSLYKVDLPDEHIARMLDWDKPLSQQHPDVQASLNQYSELTGKPFDPNATGEQIYRSLRGSNLPQADAGQIESAKQLNWAGIPGIRYLDGGSRGTGTGTSNFVVFPGNENLLQIQERNGQPIGLLGN